MLFPNAAIPLNKQLYTLSYVCVTSGAAALVFSALYIMVCLGYIIDLLSILDQCCWNQGLVELLSVEYLFVGNEGSVTICQV